jgi:CheY-like chemotaxis protein
MGGWVGIEDSSPAGTIMRLELPFPATQAAPSEHSRDDEDTVSLKGVRVLIVDDNDVNLMVASRFVRRMGASVTAVPTGHEALSLLQTGVFDIALLDRHMPEIDGEKIVKRVRAGRAGDPALPIVMVTADASERDRAELLNLGANGFVAKPIRPRQLQTAISEALSAQEFAQRQA